MKRNYDIAVVIGRFEPFHNVHFELVKKALETADEVLILLGTYKAAPDPKNPFPASLREAMIQSCFHGEDRKRLHFKSVRDHVYNYNIWLAEVQNMVKDFQEDILIERNVQYEESEHHIYLSRMKVALVGHIKDATSDYLTRFPQWTFEPFFASSLKESQKLNATDVRRLFFEGDKYEQYVPEPVAASLRSFATTQTYTDLKAEYAYNKKYEADSRFVGMPFKPTFTTTDSVVVCNGHVLLVKRGFNPGRGLMALPGGFLQPELFLIDNAVKELREETKIKVPTERLKKSIRGQHVFDYPYRSLRGRTVTHAFYFELDDVEGDLPTVSRKGGDDAAGSFWIPISSLPDYEDKFFEDHYEIIKHFIRSEVIRGE